MSTVLHRDDFHLAGLRISPSLTGAQREFALDVLRGLSAPQKWLSPKWFYDAEGSALFERITELDEYYLTRTEQEIFDAYSNEMISMLTLPVSVFELGAGTSRKTMTLLRALLRRQAACVFTTLDVSNEALQFGKRSVESTLENVRVSPVLTDYTRDMNAIRDAKGRKLLLYIGSSIGNFEIEDAKQLLRRIAASLAPGDAFLLGTDLRPGLPRADGMVNKTQEELIAAYDDAQGVTAAFNKNVLARMNRELKADFNLDRFQHVAVWNEELSRIEMHLESDRDQRVTIAALGWSVNFAKGERIHTESSHKYTPEQVMGMLQEAGLKGERVFFDTNSRFALTLARKS